MYIQWQSTKAASSYTHNNLTMKRSTSKLSWQYHNIMYKDIYFFCNSEFLWWTYNCLWSPTCRGLRRFCLYRLGQIIEFQPFARKRRQRWPILVQSKLSSSRNRQNVSGLYQKNKPRKKEKQKITEFWFHKFGKIQQN